MTRIRDHSTFFSDCLVILFTNCALANILEQKKKLDDNFKECDKTEGN